MNTVTNIIKIFINEKKLFTYNINNGGAQYRKGTSSFFIICEYKCRDQYCVPINVT